MEATPATDLALAAAQLSNGNLLGAMRDKDTHRLKVIAWDIDYTGGVSRLDAALGDVIDQVAVTRIPGHLAATACTQAGQKLGIAVWDCILKTGTTTYTVKRLGDNGQEEPVRAARVAAACWAKGLVTAIQDPDTNHLKLIAWHVASDFTVVKKAVVTAQIEVDRIAIVNVSESNDDPRNRFATAVRKTDGSMQVNVWDVAADASSIRLRDVDAPPSPANIKDVAITSMGALYASDLKLSTGQIATAAIRNIDNKYRLTSWTVSSNGKLSRTVDVTSAEVKRVTLDFLHTINLQRDFSSTPLYEIFSAVEFTDGKLGLLKWSAFVDPIVSTAQVMVSAASARHGAMQR
jgi:hypothetical protein